MNYSKKVKMVMSKHFAAKIRKIPENSPSNQAIFAFLEKIVVIISTGFCFFIFAQQYATQIQYRIKRMSHLVKLRQRDLFTYRWQRARRTHGCSYLQSYRHRALQGARSSSYIFIVKHLLKRCDSRGETWL